MHKHGRDYYLSDIPLDEAIRKFDRALAAAGTLRHTESERIPLDRANGRVTAEPVWAERSSPHYDASAMDGVAVRAADTVGASETSPLKLTVGEQAVWVDTGDPMPRDADAVIMVEDVQETDSETIEIYAPVSPYQHVRALGEDIAAAELVLPQSHRLRPHDLAACAASGLTEVSVRVPPNVAIIPTGSELTPIGQSPKPGEIIEFNSLMLAAMVEEWGGTAARHAPVSDDFDLLVRAVSEAVSESDIVIVNAGSSAGAEDYTSKVVSHLGELVVHGVAIKPGHPLVLGVADSKPVLGIPGYPVSAAVTCEKFLRPLIERMLGTPGQPRERTQAVISRKVHSSLGEDEFLRVRLGRVGERTIAAPIQRGAGVVMSLVRADGIVTIPRFSEGVDAGEQVEVELLRPIESLDSTVVAIGSHDVTLDLIASELRRVDPKMTLASSNVGSLGGLLALRRGEAHIAGTHLLDEETGEYNVSFVRRYVSNEDIVLVTLVHRVQGLIVPHGNPKSIESLDDLTRRGVRFVNRQRGSGTRVLLDYLLREHGIKPRDISGYGREEFTHLAVAAAVAGDVVDVGMGVLSAARALGIDFVPLSTERYDLAIPKQYYESPLLEPVLSLIRSDDFKRKVDALGGYDTTTTGDVAAEVNRGSR
ncbi:MAG: molybdopterin biosynthesis protein [Dehalococcoidia bacterium]|nr:molybdopterin biosynthesis protein [Dehalococcoidia bacterium]